ncbi:LysR family transcriptional regulator [Marinovum sp. 2_MG-2023]|uniref:LysR family transcriptional regulator n=1 Tax=unclassified Marinovum TaxID=2647166 RepID=UPI0026E23860|nr:MULTISPECIES: LysR family transcriptional regulator [unclassified Marinovum]MDO6732674.1 LysR family transcriptional regulator [Marinovum sp. 2_MG-2023]MDO6781947.1 LysR family transcriptional regulator [Marinovum sp. 1_MG-2023]
MKLHLVPRQLLYLEAVAEHGSIQAASRALGIAASAIDRHIKTLEEANGAPLFERLPRGMRPTAAGESVIVMARRWRADADRLETDLLEMRGKEYGSVRLAGMDSLCNGVLLDLHKDLRANQPNLRLSLDIMTPTEALRALEEGTVDVAMTFNAPPMRHQHVLWQRKLRLGCIVAPNHPLATAEKLSLSDVDGHALVSQSALMPTRQYLDNRHAWFFASNRPVLTSNSIQLLKQALLQGDVAMITSELDMLPELMDGRLRFLPLKEAGLASPTISTVIDARRPLSRAARVVAEYLGSQTEELISAFAEPTAL